MCSSSSRGGTPDKLSHKVIGPFGGEGEKYQRFGEINGIKALYNKDFIKSIEFNVKRGTSTEVQRSRSSDGWKTYQVGLEARERITHLLGYLKKVEVGRRQEKIAIASLTFITNKNRTLGPIGTESGKPFTVLPAAGKIVEFFVGSTTGEDRLQSIGARVERTSEEKSVKSIGPFGGPRPWNDGIFTGVKEINLLFSSNWVLRYIRFVYDFGGKKHIEVMHPEGVLRQVEKENKVPLNYPTEYLTSIYGHTRGDGSIKALEFHTNLSTHEYGNPEEGNYFWYPSTGANKVVGFHGTWGETLNAIGVCVEPLPSQPPLKEDKPMENGSGGTEWKDGEHSHVIGYRVTDSENPKRIESITFMYDHNGSLVEGARHGGGDPSSGVWIMLNFPEERLTSLTGFWRKEGDGTTAIHNLDLRTTCPARATRVYAEKFNRLDVERFDKLKSEKKLQSSEKKELDEFKKKFKGSERFEIPEHNKGRRISGFFGRAGTCLNSIGAYVGSY